MASFYIVLVLMVVGTNLGMVRGRRKTPSDKECMVNAKEGEGGKWEVVEGKKNKERESFQSIEDV